MCVGKSQKLFGCWRGEERDKGKKRDRQTDGRRERERTKVYASHDHA